MGTLACQVDGNSLADLTKCNMACASGGGNVAAIARCQQNCAVKAGLEYLDNVERVSGLAAKTFVFGAGKAQKCWYETKNDDEKILACLAKTIPTWTTVFNSEEGLNCVFAAKDNAEELLPSQAQRGRCSHCQLPPWGHPCHPPPRQGRIDWSGLVWSSLVWLTLILSYLISLNNLLFKNIPYG